MKLDHRRRPVLRRIATKNSGSDLQARYDRALALARGFEATGDTIDAERFYQQADHFHRLLNSKAAQFIAAGV